MTQVMLLVLLAAAAALADINVMKDVTLGFGQALDKCRQESDLTEEKMEEFFHFWRDDFKFEHRELGCAIQCMSRHFNLLTDSSRMHHDNTEQFIQSFPNGEVLARQMVSLIHACEKQFDHEEDHCWRILHVAECFKHACVAHGVAPSMEMMMTEFIMEAEARNKRAVSTAVTQYSMLVKALVVALVVCAACAQLEQGILAAQYYPRPSPRPRPRSGHITFSTQPPHYLGPDPADYGRRLAQRAPRSYFDRDAELAEGNDAALRRALPHMADPRWTPDVRSRSPWLT